MPSASHRVCARDAARPHRSPTARCAAAAARSGVPPTEPVAPKPGRRVCPTAVAIRFCAAMLTAPGTGAAAGRGATQDSAHLAVVTLPPMAVPSAIPAARHAARSTAGATRHARPPASACAAASLHWAAHLAVAGARRSKRNAPHPNAGAPLARSATPDGVQPGHVLIAGCIPLAGPAVRPARTGPMYARPCVTACRPGRRPTP